MGTLCISMAAIALCTVRGYASASSLGGVLQQVPKNEQ